MEIVTIYLNKDSCEWSYFRTNNGRYFSFWGSLNLSDMCQILFEGYKKNYSDSKKYHKEKLSPLPAEILWS
jgi:hypothetical protein